MTQKLSGVLVSCVGVFFLAGCAISPQITNTARSSIEQRLLMSSLERALSGLNIEELKGKTATVDFYGLSSDTDFAKEYFTAWLQSHHVQIAPDPKQAQLRLKVFAPVLAVDKGQSFFGAPAFTVPIIGVGVPEISLFKDERHSGHAELQVYLIDADSGEFIDKSPTTTGAAHYDDYTILLVINFSRSDMAEPQEPQPAAG